MAKQLSSQKIIETLPLLELKDVIEIKEKCIELIEAKKAEAQQTLDTIGGK